MNQEIILKKDIQGLGEEGDVKKVAAGYARNYLLPFGYAVHKTEANLKRLEQEREAINKRKEEKLEASKSLVEKVKGAEVEFKVNASQTGKLFGSVTTGDIAKALAEKGFEVDKKQITLKSPIKLVGTHQADVHFYGQLAANVKVIVKSEHEPEAQPEEKAETVEATESAETSTTAETAEATETTESAETSDKS